MQRYEGLVHATARRIVDGVEEEFEDICQILRIKVLRALRTFDPVKARSTVTDAKGRTPLDRYVFMLVSDTVKDVKKKKRKNLLFIEDLAPPEDSDHWRGVRDRFEARYLSVEHDEAFADVEPEEIRLPNTLTVLERSVVLLLYAGHRPTEVLRELELGRLELEAMMESIRVKLADWAPDGFTANHASGVAG